MTTTTIRHTCPECRDGYRPDFLALDHYGEDNSVTRACESHAAPCPAHQCYYAETDGPAVPPTPRDLDSLHGDADRVTVAREDTGHLVVTATVETREGYAVPVTIRTPGGYAAPNRQLYAGGRWYGHTAVCRTTAALTYVQWVTHSAMAAQAGGRPVPAEWQGVHGWDAEVIAEGGAEWLAEGRVPCQCDKPVPAPAL